MNDKLWMGTGASGLSIAGAVGSWMDVANQVLQMGGSLLAIVSGAVSLYFLIRSKRTK